MTDYYSKGFNKVASDFGCDPSVLYKVAQVVRIGDGISKAKWLGSITKKLFGVQKMVLDPL